MGGLRTPECLDDRGVSERKCRQCQNDPVAVVRDATAFALHSLTMTLFLATARSSRLEALASPGREGLSF
jgi:hypothetical protein